MYILQLRTQSTVQDTLYTSHERQANKSQSTLERPTHEHYQHYTTLHATNFYNWSRSAEQRPERRTEIGVGANTPKTTNKHKQARFCGCWTFGGKRRPKAVKALEKTRLESLNLLEQGANPLPTRLPRPRPGAGCANPTSTCGSLVLRLIKFQGCALW